MTDAKLSLRSNAKTVTGFHGDHTQTEPGSISIFISGAAFDTNKTRLQTVAVNRIFMSLKQEQIKRTELNVTFYSNRIRNSGRFDWVHFFSNHGITTIDITVIVVH